MLSPPVSEGGLPNSVATVSTPSPAPHTAASKKSYIVVAATPDQADRLTLAQQLEGTISVSLCAEPDRSDGGRLDANRIDAMREQGRLPG